MTIAALFDAARSVKRELTGQGLTQAEVDALNAIIATWQPANPAGLSDGQAFFASVRKAFGSLSQSQVDGFDVLLQGFRVARWPLSWAAYGLATCWHETNAQLQPVAEAYYLGSKADAYRRTLRYFPWYGRGYVQCTWEANYKRADEAFGLNGALLANPDLAMQPDLAVKILVHGMQEGWFTGKKLADYLPDHAAGRTQFQNARRIINGTDKADLIAGHALSFQAALDAGGWR